MVNSYFELIYTHVFVGKIWITWTPSRMLPCHNLHPSVMFIVTCMVICFISCKFGCQMKCTLQTSVTWPAAYLFPSVHTFEKYLTSCGDNQLWTRHHIPHVKDLLTCKYGSCEFSHTLLFHAPFCKFLASRHWLHLSRNILHIQLRRHLWTVSTTLLDDHPMHSLHMDSKILCLSTSLRWTFHAVSSEYQLSFYTSINFTSGE